MIEISEWAHIALANWEVLGLFFLIAVLYSSVGFGGGSSYLAVLTLTTLGFAQLRAIALLCNIVVVSGNTFLFIKNKLFPWKKIVPLALASVPLAFLGGYLRIGQTFFFILLGSTLLVAALLMWKSKEIADKGRELNLKSSLAKDSFNGGFIGFISGMVGIGGGIFLAPILHLTNWDTPKKIAATASFFILVNSISGLFGQFMNPEFSIEPNLTLMLLLIVFAGGQIGSRLSIKFISPIRLKKATALLISIVALRILWKYLW